MPERKDKKRPNASERVLDHTRARELYISSDLSLADIAETVGRPRTTVKDWARKEDWQGGREEYRRKLAEAWQQQSIQSQVDWRVELEQAARDAAKHLRELFADPDQFRRRSDILTGLDGSQEVVESLSEKRDVQALRSATAALKDMAAICRDLFEAPTETERERLRIAVEEHEQRMQQGMTDGRIEVVFGGLSPVAEWPVAVTEAEETTEGGGALEAEAGDA